MDLWEDMIRASWNNVGEKVIIWSAVKSSDPLSEVSNRYVSPYHSYVFVLKPYCHCSWSETSCLKKLIRIRKWRQIVILDIFFLCQFLIVCVCFINVVSIAIGDNTRGGSPWAQCFQEKTRLCTGDIRGLAWGELKASCFSSETYKICILYNAW